MKFLDLWRMSSSNLWKRKTRTILTVLGVVIGIASIVVMVSLGLGLNKSMMQEIEQNGGLTTITVNAGNYYDAMSSTSSSEQNKLDDNLVEQISQMEHVEVASPVLSIYVILRHGSYEAQYVYLQAMKADAFEKMNIPIGQGTIPKKDAEKLEFLYGNHTIADFANRKTEQGYWETGELADIDLMTDDIFVIFDMDAYWTTQYNEGEESIGGENEQPVAPPKKYLIETSGVVAGDLETYNQFCYGIYCDIDKLIPQLKKVFKNKAIPGQPTTSSGKPYKDIYYDSIYVNVDDINNVTDVQKEITELGYQAESNMEWVESQQRQFALIQLALGGIGAVSLFVAAIGITNTMMMSIYERTKEIGIMKVLGCDMRNIQTLFLMEAGMIGMIGGVIGGVLSYILSAIINTIAKSSGEMMSQLSYIPPWLAGLSLVFAIVVAMVAGFFPSLRAMRLSPLAAIRNE